MNDFDRKLIHIQEFLDGCVTPNQVQDLSQQLEADPELRLVYLRLARLHAKLSTDFADEPSLEYDLRVPVPGRKYRPALLASFGLMLLMICVVFLGRASRNSNTVQPMLTVMCAQGNIKWTGDGGQVIFDLDAGKSLSGGSIETLSADAWCELQFRDGTRLILSGLSALTISDQPQKRLDLKSGTLSAHVATQPANSPLVLSSATAELKVFGTRFSVDAGPMQTILAVREGLVRLKRLTDGRIIEVPADHRAVVQANQVVDLTVTRLPVETFTWKSDIDHDIAFGKRMKSLEAFGYQLKRAIRRGELTSEEAIKRYKSAATLNDDSAQLLAMPLVLNRSNRDSNSSILYLGMLSIARSQAAPVRLRSGSRFHIEGLLEKPGSVTFGITTNLPGGGFAAKFETTKMIKIAKPDQPFAVDLHLGDFEQLWKAKPQSTDSPTQPNSALRPVGLELADWYCLTRNQDLGLCITSVELLPP